MDIQDFLKWDNWFDRKYMAKLMPDCRWPTMKVALNLLAQMPQRRILETGCVRLAEDWGGGMSTVIFAEFVHLYSGHLTTIDISAEHMNLAKRLTAGHASHITYKVSDSLIEMAQMARGAPLFDLIYLDSMDCPAEGDASVAQAHNLRELMFALQMVHSKSSILLDDSNFANGGKTLQSNAYLTAHGWTCLMSHKQSLFIKR